jgi:glucuronate isomerase
MYSWVRNLPIVDWHNHLDMRMLAEDKPLGSLYEVWVKSDPYKHRAMRICGEPERVITGDASEDEKWAAWKRTLPKLVGNPLFAWALQELSFLRGECPRVSRPPSRVLQNIENISLASWTPSKMLAKFNVEYLSPCVGAGEFLTGFTGLKGSGAMLSDPDNPVNPVNPVKKTFKVVPSLRMNAGDEIPEETLEKFHAAGCRVVDVSVDDVSILADAARWGHRALPTVAAYAAAHGWTMLLHMGARRETSSRLRAAAGPAGGFAGMRAPVDPAAVAAFLDGLETHNTLPRTILLSLNPEAHASLAVLAGSFAEDGAPGKVQLGPAWWWCDHEEGMRDVLEKNAAYGVLATFIGMTTDSRSLLSFVRHDYFRRILCRWTAEKVASGSFPDDEALLRPLLENICYKNAHDMVCSHKEHKEHKEGLFTNGNQRKQR